MVSRQSQAVQAVPKFPEQGHNKVHVLARAIESFNGAATRLENYYQHLEQRIQELNLEINVKNLALQTHLQEKEEMRNYLHNILECLPVGIVVIDLQGTVTTLNQAAEEMTGVALKEAQNKAFDEVFGAGIFTDPRLTSRYIGAIHERVEIEEEIRNADQVLCLKVALSCLKDQHGEKVGTILTLKDITELRRLEREASRNSRLAAMGEMAAKMAHEIRNPLGSIELFASVLKKEMEACAEATKIAEHISSGVRSINTIISNLLMFIRPHHRPRFKAIDIHEPLNDSLFFSSHLVQQNNGVRVSTRFASLPLMVEGDGELLKQVFLNLILNAIQALPGKGSVEIGTGEVQRNGNGRRCAVITFADTGVGIAEEDLPRVFDPFFTTKTRGTGLGLSIVHNIVKSHNGTIDIDSKAGNGTVCTVSIPLCTDEGR